MIKINSVYRPLYTSKKRYFLITGGRGSLKSTTVHDFIARLTYEKGQGVLFTRYTMTSATTSIIPEFRLTLKRMEIEADFKITNTTITNRKTGSFIYFSGIKTSSGDQTGRLKSIAGITTWVVEEGEDFRDEKTFDTIDDSIRSTQSHNRVIWIQNPTTKEHFIYKRFIEPNSVQIEREGFKVTVSNDPDVEHIHTTYHIAQKFGYLDSSWLHKANKARIKATESAERIRQSLKGSIAQARSAFIASLHSSYYYYNYIGGWLERAENVVFPDWIEGAFDESLPFVYGQDFGYNPDPLAVVKVAVDKKAERVYIDEIIYQTEIDDIPAEYEFEGISKRSLIVSDVNEGRTISNIRSAGFNIVKATKGVGSVVDDIREIKEKFTIVVTPRSNNVKTELNNYVWNDRKSSVPIDDYNHALDAMRYAFRRLVGKRKSGIRRRN